MNDLRICVVCSKVYRTDITTCPDDGTLLAVESAQPRSFIGQVLGNYRILRALGEGGAGAVYEAEHVRLGRRMAIKILHSDIVNEEMVVRFFNEARAVNEIRHPNLIDVEDFVSAPTGEHYMIMELLEGEDLRDTLTREGTLSPERVVVIGEQLAGALAAVHRVGIVHRDLKPENIFITKGRSGETCKLLDFGVAKFTNDAEGVTRVGMTIGTPAYMSPEQIVTNGVAGPRSDVYALGMVLYEALTGKPAFAGRPIGQVLRAHCSEPVTPPSQRLGAPVPASLEAAILKCLEKDPAHRFADCDELRAALLSDRAVEVISLRAPERRPRWPMLVELPAVLASLAVIALQLASQGQSAASVSSPTRSRSMPVLAPPSTVASSAPVTAPAKPAPIETPAPAPTFSVVLESTPDHASLFLGDERKPLGPAPATVSLARSNEVVSVIARFEDGTEVVQRIVPDRTLPPVTFVKPIRPAVASQPAKPARSIRPVHQNRDGGRGSGRDDTVDPFTFK